MKLNRNVVVAFKNVGSAAHNPEVFNGTLGAALEWLIQKCAEQTIAKRFTFNIARNEVDALAGIESRAGAKIDSGSMRLQALLSSVIGDDDEDDDSVSSSSSGSGSQIGDSRSGSVALDPEDTYQG